MTQPSPLANPQPWDLVATDYAAEVVPWFETFAHEALRLAAPTPGARIVDVACGPGTLSVLAAKAGHTVDALDFSRAMIDQLTVRLASLGLTSIKPHQGDGQALPYADATFDAGFSMFGLMFFPDRAKGFAELRRVLRPGAKAVVSSWYPMDQVPVLAAMFAAIREAMFQVTGTPAPHPVPSPLTTVEACRDEMSASFADVQVHEVAAFEQAPSPDDLWEGFKRTMAPVVLMKKNLGDKFAIVDEAARAALRSVIGSGPAQMKMTAHVTLGTAR